MTITTSERIARLNLLSTERITALAQMTDAQILTKAADIIEADPVVLKGNFFTVIYEAELAELVSLTPGLDTDITTPRGCHCLEGAVRDAAGIYYSDQELGLPARYYDRSPLGLVERELDQRRDRLDRYIVAQLDRTELADLAHQNTHLHSETFPSLEQIDSGDFSPSTVVYLYSDQVLAKMGAAGPAEAARILRAAAAAAEVA